MSNILKMNCLEQYLPLSESCTAQSRRRQFDFSLRDLLALVAFGATRIARDMPSSTASGTVDIIVQYKTRASAAP